MLLCICQTWLFQLIYRHSAAEHSRGHLFPEEWGTLAALPMGHPICLVWYAKTPPKRRSYLCG